MDDAGFTAYDVSDKMKERGWIVPAYTLGGRRRPCVSVLRVVVREGMSSDMADILVTDFRRCVEELGGDPRRAPGPTGPPAPPPRQDLLEPGCPQGPSTLNLKIDGDGTGPITADAPTTEFDPDPAGDAGAEGGFLPVLTSVIQRRWTSSVLGSWPRRGAPTAE